MFPSRLLPFSIAGLAVLAATIIRFVIDPLAGDRFLLPTYFAAVAFAAWYGGIGVAVVAAVMGYIAADYFFIPPRHGFPLTSWNATTVNALFAFIVVTCTILALTEVLNRANRQSLADTQRATEERERLKVTLASIGDAVIATDANQCVAFMNGVATDLTGWEAKEAMGTPLRNVFHIINEKTQQVVENPCTRVIQTRAIVGLANHSVLVAKDGVERPIDDSAAPILDDTGNLLGVILVFRDVTAQRRAEEAHQKLAQIVAYSNDAIISETMDGTITSWNSAAEKLFGFSAEEAIGQHANIIVPANYRDELSQTMRRLEAGETVEHWDTIRERKDGSLVHLSLRISPIKDSEGTVIGASKVARDITAKRHEQDAVAFLAHAGQELAALTDPEHVYQRVVRLAISYFADWCVVYRVTEQGEIEPVAHAHRDPRQKELLSDLLQIMPMAWDSTSSAVEALRTGTSQLIPDIPDPLLATIAQSDKVLHLLHELGPKSVISVPIRTRYGATAVISFAKADSQERYDERDVRFAENLAGRAATAIENAKLFDSVQQAVRQRDEFLAMLAHELRNPLAAIRYATTVARAPGQEANPELLDIIDRQTGNLARLIDDLLDVSRVSQNKITLQQEPSDAKTIASRALETVRPLFAKKHHEINVEMSEQSLPILVDALRTEQIVVNLLTNAAKYTPDGGRIGLTVCQEQNEAVIKVSDTGVGLAPEVLPRVFDLFAQADRTIDRSEGGLGIGLTIARRLAEMQGGTISAHSAGLGCGCEFALRLPIKEHHTSQTVGRPWPRPAGHKIRVLVVDDNRDTAKTAAMLLKMLGHDVHEAYDGHSAIEMFKAFRPHAVLLDLGLPGLNGFEVAQTLRNEGFVREKLIAVSGYGQPEDRRRSHEVGFDYHLVKPVHQSDLIGVLDCVAPDDV